MKTIDDYLENLSPETKEKLNEIRHAVHELVPEALESISYAMPAHKLMGKPLIYYAAYSEHIGLYATPNSHEHFKMELAAYKQGKGSVQFPLDRDLPIDLIKEIIKFRKVSIEEWSHAKNK